MNTRSLLLEIDRVLRIVVIVALLLSAPGVSLTPRVASAEARAGSGASPTPVATATTLISPLATPAATVLPLPAPTAAVFTSPLPTPTPITPPSSVIAERVFTQTGGILTLANNRVRLEVPAGLFNQPTRVTITSRTLAAAERAHGLRMRFDLTAVDTVSNIPLVTFDQPITVTANISGLLDLKQLSAHRHVFLGYQTETGAWAETADLRVNYDQGTLTVPITHFSPWGAGEAPGVPGVWAFQYSPPSASLFNGSSTYQIPLNLPAGRNGLQPKLALSYNSARLLGRTGEGYVTGASGPIGDAWNLDGLINLSREQWLPCMYGIGGGAHASTTCIQDMFVLMINGAGYELEPMPPTDSALGPTYGRYYAPDAPGLSIERRNNCTRHNNRTGNCETGYTNNNGSPLNATGEYWLIRLPDGTQARLGYNLDSEQVKEGICNTTCDLEGQDGHHIYQGYKGSNGDKAARSWRVDLITDTLNNQITFNYSQDPWEGTVTLRDIYYNFVSGNPQTHIQLEGTDNWPFNGGSWIDRIKIFNKNPAGQDIPVRRYELARVTNTHQRWSGCSPQPCDPWTTSEYTTLARVQEFDGTTGFLPAQTFTYDWYNSGDWHDLQWLATVNNGYGLIAQLAYEKAGGLVGFTPADGVNNYRLSRLNMTSGLANNAPLSTTFQYGNACYDYQGSACQSRGTSVCISGCDSSHQQTLVGFDVVTETVWNQSTIAARVQHSFYNVNPAWQMGREWQTRQLNGSNLLLTQATQVYSYTPIMSTTFTYVAQTDTIQYSGTLSVTTRITHTYDLYGNEIAQYNFGALNLSGDERLTTWAFTPNTNAWIINKPVTQTIYDRLNGSILSQTRNAYDNQATVTAPPSKGLLTRVERWDGTRWITATRTAYDTWGNPLVITDALTRTTTTAYDPQFFLYPITLTNAASQTTVMTYDLTLGVPTAVTDPNGAVTSYTYDSFGRLLSVIRPDDSVLSPTLDYQYTDGYAANGLTGLRVLQRTRAGTGDSNAYRSSYAFYDGLGRLVQTRAAGEGNQQSVSNLDYDARGLTQYAYTPVFETATAEFTRPLTYTARPRTETQYDSLGRAVKTIRPDTTFATQTYYIASSPNDGDFNNGGRVAVDFTDANGHVKRYSYDGLGNLLTVTENPGYGESRTHYAYDALGSLRVVTDALNNRTLIDYNGLSQKTVMTDTDMGVWSYAYDAVGNLTRQRDARNQRLCFFYDQLNRPIGKQYRTDDNCPTVASGLNVTYTYDTGVNGLGRRTAMEDESGRTEWSYDARGRVINEYRTIGVVGSFGLDYEYDAQDRVTAITYPNGETVAQTYNAAGQLASLSGATVYAASLVYNAPGQVTQINLGNSLSANYVYDALNSRLKRIQTGSLFALDYAYDPVGNLSTITDTATFSPTAQIQRFRYDALDRVISATASSGISGTYGETYAYNAIGNITFTSRLGTYGYTDTAHVHAVTTLSGAVKFGYDANGNMISRVELSGTQPITYLQSWDAENRLRVVTNTLTREVTQFVYDGDGTRVLQIYSGMYTSTTAYFGRALEINAIGAPPPITTTIYPTQTRRCYLPLIRGDRIARTQPLANETWKQYYAAGAQLIALRVLTTTGSVPYYLQADHLGSASLTTNAGGGLVARQLYDAWGNVRYMTGTLQTDIGFTGQQRNSYIKLIQMGARWYDPAIGRWSSADTIVPDPKNPQSLNRYSYVRNSPINRIDPSGHVDCDKSQYGGDCQSSTGHEKDQADAHNALCRLDPKACVADTSAGHMLELAAFGTAGFTLMGLMSAAPEAIGALLDKLAPAAGAASTAGAAACADGDCTNEIQAGSNILRTTLDALQRLLGNCSFSAGTLVATEDGERPIGTLKVGDHVLAYDQSVRANGLYTVTAVLAHTDPIIAFVTIDGERIETTPEHPFFTEERGWLPAGELWRGTHVRNADGKLGIVQRIEIVPQQQPMYNLTVESAHTFFVGTRQWLVHNACPITGNPQVTSDPTHALRSVIEALRMQASGIYAEIYLNKALSTVTGGQVADLQRPDIVGVTLQGTYDLVEVVSSASQSVASQIGKINAMIVLLQGAGLNGQGWIVP